MKNKDTQFLINLWHQANDAYYNIGEPIMSDTDFNELENELGIRGVDTKELAISDYGETISHQTIMPSLKKVNVKGEFNEGHMTEIIKHLSKSPSFREGQNYTLDFKMDGLAINAIFENGNFVSAATRGDYFNGRNVTEKVKHLIPQKIESNITELRYECIIPISTFVEKYSDEYSHPRNLAGGILNDIDIKDVRKNDLVLRSLNAVSNGKFINNINIPNDISSSYIPSEVLNYNGLNDFDTLKMCFDKMLKLRSESDFPIDGLVLSPYDADANDHNGKYPNHSVSIKFPPKGSKAIVKGIEWNLKRSGEYFPVVLLEPVTIDGRVIRKTHGFNYGFVSLNRIEKGAEVRVDIAGDIIPYLESVLKPSQYQLTLPEGSLIDGCHLTTTDSDAIKLESFVFGAMKLDLKDFGDSFYRKVASHYNYVPYNILLSSFTNEVDLLELGLSKGKVEKFLKRISEKSSIKLDTLIHSLSFKGCGEGTSLEVSKYIALKEFGVDSDDFEVEYDFARKQHDVIESCTKGENFKTIMGMLDNLGDTNKSLIHVELAKPKKNLTSNDGEEIKYMMTGSPKSFDYKTKAVFKGVLPKNFTEVKKINDATLLITDDLESNSSKMKKAKSMGIEIKTYGDF